MKEGISNILACLTGVERGRDWERGKKGGEIGGRGGGKPAIRTPFCSFLRPVAAAKSRLAENRNLFLDSINIHADKQKLPCNEEAHATL